MAITVSQKYRLNHMNKVSSDVALGTLISDIDTIIPTIVKKAGIFNTVGGNAAEDITLAGVVATDAVIVTLHTVGAAPVTVAKAVTAAGKITVTFSADPAADHKINYVVLGAR
jgi:hypothetical protein